MACGKISVYDDVHSVIIAVVRYDNNARWHVVQGNYIRNWVGRLLMAFAGNLLRETLEKKTR